VSRCAPPLIALTVWCLLTGARGQASQAATSSPAAGNMSSNVTVTDQDNGKDIDLTTGSVLIVKLQSNPSTGYAWTVAGDPSPLRLEKSSYVKNTKASKAVGASGTQVLRLNANSGGMATLTVVYRRSWEYNILPVKTFSLRVNIR
jgi:inhibitor of cysteine peptidase